MTMLMLRIVFGILGGEYVTPSHKRLVLEEVRCYGGMGVGLADGLVVRSLVAVLRGRAREAESGVVHRIPRDPWALVPSRVRRLFPGEAVEDHGI